MEDKIIDDDVDYEYDDFYDDLKESCNDEEELDENWGNRLDVDGND